MKAGCKTCGKMKSGGSAKSKSCPPGYYWSVQGCIKKLPGHKEPLSSGSAKAAVATFLGGLTGAAAAKIAKKRAEKKEIKKDVKDIKSTLDKTKVMKKGGSTNKNWMQDVSASIKRRGTEGVCTGSKFGGPGCPPGSKRYNLAKTFKKIAKNR